MSFNFFNKYNKEGYDKRGYDKEGYDKEGYDGGGYDKYGYDKKGYDENGYDKEGYNKKGYNKKHYDKNGKLNPRFVFDPHSHNKYSHSDGRFIIATADFFDEETGKYIEIPAENYYDLKKHKKELEKATKIYQKDLIDLEYYKKLNKNNF